MKRLDHSDTLDSDIVVKLDDVSKFFKQKRPSEKFSDIFSNLFNPTIITKTALQKINLTIKRGEIVAYAGVNGSGKSTTIRLLCGMLAPSTGEVRVLGHDPVKDRINFVKKIGVVFGQRTELWWDHPVASSYEWKKVVWDIDQKVFNRMVELAKDLLGIGDFYHTFARELSLGQRMRAELGLMLLHEPEIFFMDEPTLGLDVVAKKNILSLLKKINQERNTTIMITSHDMDDLEFLASRLVMINKGEIAFDGNFSELRQQYANKRLIQIQTKENKIIHIPSVKYFKTVDENKFQYLVDLSDSSIMDILNQLNEKATIFDIETYHLKIDDVIASIFEQWQR